MLMSALKEVVQSTLIKTKLHIKVINKSKVASKMVVRSLKY